MTRERSVYEPTSDRARQAASRRESVRSVAARADLAECVDAGSLELLGALMADDDARVLTRERRAR